MQYRLGAGGRAHRAGPLLRKNNLSVLVSRAKRVWSWGRDGSEGWGGAGPTLGGGPSEEVTEREAGPWHAAPPMAEGSASSSHLLSFVILSLSPEPPPPPSDPRPARAAGAGGRSCPQGRGLCPRGGPGAPRPCTALPPGTAPRRTGGSSSRSTQTPCGPQPLRTPTCPAPASGLCPRRAQARALRTLGVPPPPTPPENDGNDNHRGRKTKQSESKRAVVGSGESAVAAGMRSRFPSRFPSRFRSRFRSGRST